MPTPQPRAGRAHSDRQAHQVRRTRRVTAPDAGMATAEYALGTLAACAFAVVLYKVVTSAFVTDLLKELVHRALTMAT